MTIQLKKNYWFVFLHNSTWVSLSRPWHDSLSKLPQSDEGWPFIINKWTELGFSSKKMSSVIPDFKYSAVKSCDYYESKNMVATYLVWNEILNHMTSNSNTFSVSDKVLCIQWEIERIHFLTIQLIL